MHHPFARLWIMALLVGFAVVIPVTNSSLAATAHTAPTACPLTHAPTSPLSVPWLGAKYQSEFSSNDLAQQVLNCEAQFHSSTSFLAEVALIGLNNTTNKVFQNQNMWLANNSGQLTAQDDFETLGIPPLTLEDGPDGVIYQPPSGQPKPTEYPNEIALAATMNPQLAEQFGQQLGQQSSTLRFMGIQAPDLNIDRIPNWGRMQETFGEDPVLAGEMGAAESIGILQSSHLDVLKHFGVYGQEASRRTINDNLSTTALYDTYLRSFAITTNAVANSSAVPTGRQVLMMCSYGNLNGERSCISPTLTKALSQLPFSGLVRSDLDTVTTSPALLRNGVSLIKPLDAQEFEPESSVSAQNRSLVRSAAQKVLATMFTADLITPSQVELANKPGELSAAMKSNGTTLANAIEAQGAVLLKDGALSAPGSLPVMKSTGSVALLAPSNLSATCAALATWIQKYAGNKTTCTIWNQHLAPVTILLHNLASGSNRDAKTAAVKWIAPSSGPYLVNNTSFGDSTLALNGATIQSQPGISEIYAQNDSTINFLKGHSYTFKETWQSVGPYLTIRALGPSVAVATKAARQAHSAIILADDYAAEGADINELTLPDGQDSAISAVSAAVPTSVALLTTGPILMPWLTSVKSVLELWNPGGLPPFDNQLVSFVPAYGSLLDGRDSPSGHLPITFPANVDESPMSLGTGGSRFAYWPGINGTANLDVAPDDGSEIGYGWYHAENWPVLFPFGFGLTYATMTTSFSSSTSCAANDSATSICLPVAVRLTNDVGRPASASVQIYVSQPTSVASPRPPLVLGTASTVSCRNWSGVTGACDGTATNETITALDVGAWSLTANAYQLQPGCYSFVVASNSTNAYSALANPSQYPGQVVSADAPFSSDTVLTPGGCPA